MANRLCFVCCEKYRVTKTHSTPYLDKSFFEKKNAIIIGSFVENDLQLNRVDVCYKHISALFHACALFHRALLYMLYRALLRKITCNWMELMYVIYKHKNTLFYACALFHKALLYMLYWALLYMLYRALLYILYWALLYVIYIFTMKQDSIVHTIHGIHIYVYIYIIYSIHIYIYIYNI